MKYLWKCNHPGCNAKGNWYLPHYKALHNVRFHSKNRHSSMNAILLREDGKIFIEQEVFTVKPSQAHKSSFVDMRRINVGRLGLQNDGKR